MIAYVDSSVILRKVLGQRNALKQWKEIDRGITSALAEVECLRTLDRRRLLNDLADEPVAASREAIFRILDALEFVELARPVLDRATQPLPTALGTLDAIHLTTALLSRERAGMSELVLATHDAALGMAARATGLRVVGL